MRLSTRLLPAISVATLFGAMLFGAACGGDSDDSGGEALALATGVEGVTDGSPFVDQDSLKFKPKAIVVPTGEEIYFKNSESAIHTVTIDGDNESGTMKHDDVFQWTPPGPGVYKITCDFHPQMKATITVE